MRRRTRARELAVQFLCQMDIRNSYLPREEEIDKYLKAEDMQEEVHAFAKELITGYVKNKPQIDGKIASASRNWTLDRMFVVDRNIIRLATYELLHVDDVPPKVTINEAVELAKKYSSGKSKGFVNGVLDSIFHTDARYKLAS